MNKVIVALNKIRLRQILMACLAGILVVVSTACSNPGNSTDVVQGSRQDVPAGLEAVPGKKNPRPEVPEEVNTNTFKGASMNEFSDTDPRVNMEPASEKAKVLIDKTERNVIDETGDIGETTKRILDKKGENVDEIGRNLSKSAEDTKSKAQGVAEDVTAGTKQKAEDVKQTVKANIPDADELTSSAKRAANDVKQTVKANTPDADKLTSSAKQTVDDATENSKATGIDLVDRGQRAIENAGEFVQSKLNQTAKGTQQNLEKVGDTAKDVID